jgi:hypothetical protein
MSRSPSFAVALATALTLVLAAPIAAQAPATIQVPLAAAAPDGPEGLAILSLADTGSAVQVLAPGAPDGTTAVIQRGTCDIPGMELVGLIGQIPATGQASAIVPVPLATLADGGHVVALHAGLDFATALACGAIPATPGLDPGPAATVPPGPGATPTAAPVDQACVGVPDWVAMATGHLDRFDRLEADLGRQTADFNAYMATLASTIGQVGVMVEDLRTSLPPEAAADAHAQLLAAFEDSLLGGRTLSDALMAGDTGLYQQALSIGNQAREARLKVRTLVGELQGRCPAPTT